MSKFEALSSFGTEKPPEERKHSNKTAIILQISLTFFLITLLLHQDRCSFVSEIIHSHRNENATRTFRVN